MARRNAQQSITIKFNKTNENGGVLPLAHQLTNFIQAAENFFPVTFQADLAQVFDLREFMIDNDQAVEHFSEVLANLPVHQNDWLIAEMCGTLVQFVKISKFKVRAE